MVNRLSEPELLKVQNYIKRTFSKRKNRVAPTMKTYTKEEFLQLVDDAEKDIETGKVYSWEEVREQTRQKYGF